MRMCSICKIEKEDEFFRKDNGRGTTQRICKICAGPLEKSKGRYLYQYRSDTLKRYRYKNKDQIAARSAVWRAVKKGWLTKKPCIKCGITDGVHAHHHAGYAKKNWLDILWLCGEHHKQEHYENK